MNDGDDYPFGSLMRGYRVRAEISQQELALKLGKHRNTIGAWELGSSLPKTRSLIVEMGRVLFLANADVGRLLDAAFFSSRLRETEVPPPKQEESTQLTPSPLPTRHDYYAHIPLSPNYIKRAEVLAEVRSYLLSNVSSVALASSVKLQTVGFLHGMAGVGKTVIARALCDDPAIQAAFPDGILWATLGQIPELMRSMREWVTALGGTNSENFSTLNELKSVLAQLLQDRACLLILDDVWRRSDAEAFRVGGPSCRLLVTTRDAEISYELGGRLQPVPVMTEDEAIRLLDEWADGHLSEADPGLKDEIIRRLGHLPLAVKLAGAQLQSIPPEEWLHAFDLRRETSQHVGELHSNLELTFRQSLVGLDADAYHLYIALAVFKEDGNIPQGGIERLWQGLGSLDADTTADLLQDLEARALLELTSTHTVRLHDLLRDLIKRELGERHLAMHQALIDAYRATCAGVGWHTARDDGYLYEHLTFHLHALSAASELRDLFANQHWLQARVTQSDYAYNGYLEDLSYAWKYAYDETKRQIEADLEPSAFAECIRYLLIRASINDIVNDYPPELVVRAFELGLWTSQRAFSVAETVPDPEKRAKMYAALLRSSKLSKAQQEQALRSALRATLRIQRYESRATILAELAPRLNREELIETLKMPLVQTDEQERMQILAALDPQVAKQQPTSWKKMVAQVAAVTPSLVRESLKSLAKDLPRNLDPSEIKIIRQSMVEFLWSFQHSSRREVFQHYCVKELFSPPLYSTEILTAIASHIVEICEEWSWL